ncbi:Hsp70 family protein [Prosthecobacter sp.]
MNLLGIDFGTTKTLAARWDERTQSARTIRLGRGSDAIPTTVYADKSGKLEFGDDADDMRALDAAGWKGRIKRDLGSGVAVVLNGHRYSVVELVSEFLSYVLKRVEEEVFHGPVNGVVITVPALYGPAERQELLEAARKAGFQNVELIEEPIAAGLAFLHEKTGTELGEQIFVFDWGGGTLDLALVNYKNGDLSLNHEWIGGDKNLGGEDIDDSIIEGVDTLCATDHGLIDDQDDHRRLQIRRNLKEGKELLSRRSEHTFRLGFKQPVEFKWSRDELESYTATTVNRALDCLREQLRKLATEGIHPRQVLLIGGASSMPVIKRRIEGEMAIKAITWEHFHTAVALGAASHTARIRSNSQTVDSDKRSRPPKVSKKYAKEVFVENKHEKNPAPERQFSKDATDPYVNWWEANAQKEPSRQDSKDTNDASKCLTCGGAGQITSLRGSYQIQVDCPDCGGNCSDNVSDKSFSPPGPETSHNDKAKNEPIASPHPSTGLSWMEIICGVSLIVAALAGVTFGAFPAFMLGLWGFKILTKTAE